MQDASSCRARAELCKQIARLLSDPEAAADLRAEAAEHLARAFKLETQSSALFH
jgi:hypothetical protein